MIYFEQEYMEYEELERDYYSERISPDLKIISVDPVTGEYVSDTVRNLILRKNEAY